MNRYVLTLFVAALIACGSSNDTSTSSSGSSGSPQSSTDPTVNDAGANSETGTDANSKNDGSGTCAEVTRAMCEGGAKCAATGTAVLSHGGAATETHDSVEKCATFYQVIACPGYSPVADFKACEAALATATCTSTKQGPALAVPTPCEFK